MRTLLYLLTALGVMVLAFWAYRENYRTQATIDQMQKVQTEIAGLRERLGLLRAEWAFLNRPERLNTLVNLNFDKLRLAPLTPGQFVRPDQITFPLPGTLPGGGTEAGPGAEVVWTGPSQNPGAPPRRPAVTANPMSADDDPAAAPATTTAPANANANASESQP